MSGDDFEILRARALAFAADDPDPFTRATLERAASESDEAALRAALEPRLEFGTAGLRGAVGAGPARMNLLVCARFAWALGTFLNSRPLPTSRCVVVGFDARRDSRRFADVIARILAGLGLEVISSAGPVPTPLVAFAVLAAPAAAGVVVTASHNPAGDNGIKLYDDQGVQIVAPWDRDIEDLIERAPAYTAMHQASPSPGRLEAELAPAYLASLRARAERWRSRSTLRVAYTPIHGVGLHTLSRALEGQAVELVVVPEQAAPNPEFPTAPFPNPEEPGVLDRVFELCRREQAEVALATDPDADRLAVGLPDGRGNVVGLSGDEVGLLLADGLFDEADGPPVCVRSVVSSPALDVWASARGGRVVRTLTGFKWLARAALDEGPFLLAYEEALGYCPRAPVGHLAPLDKDGLGAALEFIGCVLRAGSGSQLLERLALLSAEIGVWVSAAASVRLGGALDRDAAKNVMDALRRTPPRALSADPVVQVTDYLEGAEARSPWLGRQDLLELQTRAGSRVCIRPSGTEPKIKVYAHVVGAARGATVTDYLSRRGELLEQARRLTSELALLLRSGSAASAQS
jgi:phosphomannomutase